MKKYPDLLKLFLPTPVVWQKEHKVEVLAQEAKV
jgi:hypothetical protein